MKKILESDLNAAKNGDEQGMISLLEWWAWNDPNGLWQEAIAHVEGATADENPEGWDPMADAAGLVQRTLDYLGEEQDLYIIRGK